MNQHTADVILRSSDGKLFYSCKALLSMSSSVFRGMFDLPQPLDCSDNVDDGRPVIDVTEDNRTLEHILSLCHPAGSTGKPFKVENVHELGAVLEATTKYDMENGRIVALEELASPSFIHQDPTRIYALACQYKCSKAARLAAKRTLALPTLMHEYMPEFERIDAGKLCRLLLYREACMAAASPLADDHTWLTYSNLFRCDGGESGEDMGWTTVRHSPSRKYPRGRVESVSVHTWWLAYMKRSGNALQRSPHGDAVKDQDLVNEFLTTISSSTCKRCNSLRVCETFRSFVDTFANEVERRVAEVEINLGF